MDIERALEEIGLSRQEARVYISTLKLGVAKASQIAQKSRIKRGGVYYLLKLLREKGLVSEVIKAGVAYYNTVSPERILDIIEDEKEKKTSAIKEVLPELKGLQQIMPERPTVEFYEGHEGFKTIFSKLIEKPNQEFLCYISSRILDYMPYFHAQFRKRRVAQNINIRTITERTKLLEEIKKTDKQELRETRFNDGLFKNAEVLQYILDDAIVAITASKQEQLAVYIKEKKLAQLHKNIFENLWKQAKP